MRSLLVLICLLLTISFAHAQEDTPEPTPEITPVSTLEVTPEATLDTTAEPTAEITPETTLDVTPEVTAEATEAAAFEREYELFVPSDFDPDEPAPLMIVLHGASGTGAWIREITDFDTYAEDAGFLVAYPTGVANNWDFGTGVATPDGVVRTGDVQYLVNMISEIDDDYPVDEDRVFAVGFSNGASMAYHLGCQAPDVFRAVAGVAALVYAGTVNGCALTPMPILFIHGTLDPILPWQRLTARDGRVIGLTGEESFNFWAQRNQCERTEDSLSVEDIEDTDPEDGSTVVHFTVSPCADESEVQFYAIIGGGHTWAGHPFESRFEIGSTNMDIDASQIIVDWFAQF